MEALKIGLALSLVSVCALPSVSHAESNDSVRLNAGAGVGVLGEVKAEMDDAEDDEDDAEGYDLDPTPGLYVGLEVPLHQYFTLGGELGLSFWNDEDSNKEDVDYQKQLDLLARPKLRLSPVDGLELYAVVPVGLTYYIPSSDMDSEEDGYKVEANGGVGFAVGASAGATYFVTDHFGLTAEAGYLYRKANFGFEATAPDGESAKADGKVSFGQLQLRAGIAVAF